MNQRHFLKRTAGISASVVLLPRAAFSASPSEVNPCPALDHLDLTDPHEPKNLIGRNPDREKSRTEAARMKGLLTDWLGRVKSPLHDTIKARPVFAGP